VSAYFSSSGKSFDKSNIETLNGRWYATGSLGLRARKQTDPYAFYGLLITDH
jgi:hypothetical protein